MVGDTSFVGCWRIVLRIRSVVICSVVLMSCVVTVFGCVVVTVFGSVVSLRCVCCNLYGLSWVVTVFGTVVMLLGYFVDL